jgi:hypothetical protein
VKLRALEDSGKEGEAHVQRALLARLIAKLKAEQGARDVAAKAESQAHNKVSEAVAWAAMCDERTARLKLTGESLSQGITQMLVVRAHRSQAVDAQKKVDEQRAQCLQKRLYAKQKQRKVRSPAPPCMAMAVLCSPSIWTLARCNRPQWQAHAAPPKLSHCACVQADVAQKDAAAARKAKDTAAAHRHDRDAADAQRAALVSTREAEAAWAESLQLVRQVQKHDAAADAGLRIARRLSSAGECTWQAQELADSIAALAKEAKAAAARAESAIAAAAAHTQVCITKCIMTKLHDALVLLNQCSLQLRLCMCLQMLTYV